MNVLILCTHNSARSVLAEAMLNKLARQLNVNVQAYSAGSEPSGRINPYALEVLQQVDIDTDAFYSKNQDVFTDKAGVQIDVVITVCDSAAKEVCPFFPGAPITVHWGYPDPSTAEESERLQAFELTRQAIAYKMMLLLQLPFESMGKEELKTALRKIALA